MSYHTLAGDGIIPREHRALATAAGLELRRVSLPNFELYAAYHQGVFFYTVFTEQYDEPVRWEARSTAEREAMVVLAMDEWLEQRMVI